jgi:ubiquinone/menaquinone biosynthesis C-methylase UbiE
MESLFIKSMDQSYANQSGKLYEADTDMESTGERMVPGKTDAQVFWEHIYRYRFAAKFVHGKRVLDIACGEGYGTAALGKAGAVKTIGVDISAEACAHGRKKYGIDTRVGSAEQIPLENASVDVVVSFETIEHVPHPEVFLDECKRVLTPGGQLVISTPDRETYHQVNSNNRFHCSELSYDEFVDMCAKRFKSMRYFSQRPYSAERWSLRGMAIEYYQKPTSGLKPRLAWILQNLLCKNLSSEASRYFGERPIEAVFAKPGMFSSLVDPYVVRSFLNEGRDKSLYTIAIAQMP